jgi:hypothetical protein
MCSSANPLQPWARLSVLRGATPQSITFRAGQPHELTLGSAACAQLALPASCAAPLQLEALWDGAALWLQDRLRLGTTLVGGRPLNEWTLVRGQVLVAIGRVRLWLAAASPHPTPNAPDFARLEHARGAALRMRRMPTLRLLPSLELPLSEASGS